MRYLYIESSATLQPVLHLRDAPPLTLDQLRALVGGYIEEIYTTVPRPGETRMIVMDNEDGLALDLAPSVRFPLVYSVGGVLRGPVVLMGVDDRGEQADLTTDQLKRVTLRTTHADPYPTLLIRD